MSRLTLVAASDDRFERFSPYAASLDLEGRVTFQAALRDGTTGVFVGTGQDAEEIARSTLVRSVTSHPDRNAAGDVSFYGTQAGGGEAVFLVRDGDVRTIAETGEAFVSIGPAGPTMNREGAVAFRADPSPGVSGVFVAADDAIVTIADTQGPWAAFQGLPIIDARGEVTFRADKRDGEEGIYRWSEGSIRTVVATGGDFASFRPFPSVNDDGVVAFAATLSSGDAGIFTARDGRIETVEIGGAFESYRGALMAASNIVRIATPLGARLGLFEGPDPGADRILAVGDDLLGSSVAEFAANPVSVNDAGQVAIRASLNDGRQLILRSGGALRDARENGPASRDVGRFDDDLGRW
jgi:hypothetical protein